MSHAWSQVDLYHVLYLPETNNWPLHSPKTVSVLAKIHFHAWVSISGTPISFSLVFKINQINIRSENNVIELSQYY